MRQRWPSLSLLVATAVLLASVLSSSRLLTADDAGVSTSNSSATKPNAASEVKKPAKPGSAAKAERAAAVSKSSASITKVTAEREAVAIAFATKNHPELATLLSNLKQNNPSEYHAAVIELDRIVERLAALKLKNVSQHDLELAHWQRDSRIRLLAARLTMSDNPALEAELKAAVHEKLEQTLIERKAERERLQKRAEKLDQSISELSTKLDELAEKEFAALKRSAHSNKPTPKSKPNKKSDVIAPTKPAERSAGGKQQGGAKPVVDDPQGNSTAEQK